MKKIMTVMGTRPEIIKLSPILPLLDKNFNHILIHSGQHYDYELDKIFFEELELKDPDYNLKIGSHLHGKQTALILERLEPIIEKENPDFIMVQGDTNTTLGGALTGVKLLKKIIHLEAGCRAFNKQPEEYNRVMVDHISDYLLAPDTVAYQYLINEGINKKKIFLVGSTVFDAVLRNKKFIPKSKIFEQIPVKDNYILLTTHRAENTIDKNLRSIIVAVNHLSKKIPIIFPIHPRTQNKVEESKITISKNVHIIKSVGYIDFLNLLSHCLFALTDSGGVQEEALVFNKPCLVLKTEIEWIRLVEMGKNIIVGANTKKIIKTASELIDDPQKLEIIKNRNYSYDIDVSKKIEKILRTIK